MTKAVPYLAVMVCASRAVQADLPPPLPKDEQARAALLKMAGDGFRVRESDHFTIAYNTTPHTVSSLISRLEGTFDAIWRFCEGRELPIRPPAARLQVLFFDREEEFARFCASVGFSAGSLAGIYHDATNLSAFSNTLNRTELRQITGLIEQAQSRLQRLNADRSGSATVRERRKRLRREFGALRSQRDAVVEKFNRLVIQHEAAHQMFFNIGVHVRGATNTVWVVEGLACQFEVPQTRAGAGLRRINHMRLADLRDALQLPLRAKRLSEDAYRRAFKSGRLIPLTDLVSDRGLFSNPRVNLNVLYAHAWALVYYLQREHQEQFAGYLRRLSARKPGEDVDRRGELGDFEAAFGPVSDDFQHAWISFVVQLRLDRKAAGR